MDNQKPGPSGLVNKKKTPTEKVFQSSWLKKRLFKDWLKSDDNGKNAICTVCDRVLASNKSELIRHSRTRMHMKRTGKSCDIPPSVLLPEDENIADLKHVNKVKRAEIKIAAFYAEHNIPFRTVNQLIPLIKEICSDPQVVRDLKLPETESTQTVQNVVGSRESGDNFIRELQTKKFSILIDQRTTVANDKSLCILVKYVSSQSKKCVTQLLESITLDNKGCSADKIYSKFKSCLESKNIPLSNIVGMACDNASVMPGIGDCFISKLKKEVPALVVLKCMCHSSTLIASKACAQLPESCEKLLHSVATYFHEGAKRSTILREFQELFEVESRKILKLSGTRCLILQKCVAKLLDNWDVLKHYFYLETVKNNNNSAAAISNSLNDCKIKAFMLFLKYSLSSFNDFNTLFQGNKVLLHKLAETSEHLIKQMGHNFLLPHALKNISMDIIHHHNFIPLSSIHVGPECEAFLQTQTGGFIANFKSTCLSFYTTAFQEMVEILPYNDEIIRELKFLDASIALSTESRLAFPDLRDVAGYFKISNITAFAYEWRMLPFVFEDDRKSLLAGLEVDDMWKTIFEEKDFNKDPLLPNLETLVQTVLSLPHSNAEAERLFTIVTDAQ